MVKLQDWMNMLEICCDEVILVLFNSALWFEFFVW